MAELVGLGGGSQYWRQAMLEAAVLWLGCLAIFLEVTYRAPLIDWMD